MSELRGQRQEPFEPRIEPVVIWHVDSASREVERCLVETLQQIEHRSIIVVEQTSRYVDYIVRRDTDEVLVESAMVDRAQTQTIPNRRLAAKFDVSNDVRGVEQAQLS